jgi:hypothetical protein
MQPGERIVEMYAPQLGIFLSRDPSSYGNGSNAYEYVDGNPPTFADPLGLQSASTNPSQPPSTQPSPPTCDPIGILGGSCPQQPLPIDPGTPIIITIITKNILAAAGIYENSCYDLTITNLTCQQSLTKTGNCDLLVTDICALAQVEAANSPLRSGCGDPTSSRCCYKLSLSGNYPITANIDVSVPNGWKLWQTCNLKGTVSASANVTGKIGTCVSVPRRGRGR